jgi:hypothetical protein
MDLIEIEFDPVDDSLRDSRAWNKKRVLGDFERKLSEIWFPLKNTRNNSHLTRMQHGENLM